jgi:hypothetical protein
MESLLELSFQYFHLLLVPILIGLVILILSIFIKKRIPLITVMAVLIIGSVIVFNQTKYTTLLELYSNQLNEDSVVKSVSITIQEPSENVPEKIRRVTIEKKEVIEQILEDFSGIELKEDDDIQQVIRDYQIELVVTNQIEEDHFSTTTTIHSDIDKNYVNDYRIISETNHLKTIESQVEDDKVDGKNYE